MGTLLSNGSKGSQVLFVISILLYTVTTLLVLLQNIGEVSRSWNVTIASIVFCFITGMRNSNYFLSLLPFITDIVLKLVSLTRIHGAVVR